MGCIRTWSSTLAALALGMPASAAAAPGDLDTSFGVQGVFQQDLGPSGGGSSARTVLALPGDRLLAAGQVAAVAWFDSPAVARHLEAGTLDRSFGSAGFAQAPAGFCGDSAEMISASTTAAALGPDGRIVVTGWAIIETDEGVEDTRATVAVFTPTGGLDASFGARGTLCEQYGDGSSFADVLVQPDGKIVAAGDDGSQALVVRYLPDGRRDSRFGVDGVVLRQFGPTSSAVAVARQPDGNLLLAGSVRDDAGRWSALVARLTENGTPDTSFGGGADGSVRPPLASDVNNRAAPSDLAIDPQRRVLVAGQESLPEREQAILARLDPDGRLDDRFGSGGVSRPVAGLGPATSSGFRALVPQADGKVVAAGFATDERGSTGALLSRVDTGGKPDPGFGNEGAVRTQHGVGASPESYWTSVTLDSSGRIAAAGPAGGLDEEEEWVRGGWTIARFLNDSPGAAPGNQPEPRSSLVPRLRLPSSATVGRGGVVRLRLRCAGAVACRGVLTLTRNRVRVARATVTLAAGARRTVRVRLNAAGRRLLRRHPRITVHATTRLRRSPDAPVVAVTKLRLRRVTSTP